MTNLREQSDRIDKIENKLETWKKLIIGSIAFLGLGTSYGLYTLYQRTLEQAEIAVFEAAKARLTDLAAQAETDAERIKSAIKQTCYDPKWVDATGSCIFNLLPEGKYSLNYGAAAALCTAHGARLCTLKEVEAAYSKGAEWCAWGWVADLKKGSTVVDISGTVAYPMQSGASGGCSPGMNISPDQNIMTTNRGANCCI